MSPSSDRLFLRPATAADVPAVIALVDAAYGEHGDRVCLEDGDQDLLRIHEHYAALGGECVVLVDGERVVGVHAVVPLETPGVCTFRRLYLAAEYRGLGAGDLLMLWALERAEEFGFRRVEFWSDARFARAHRFFERLGFARDGRVRTMHDGWTPYDEFFFSREL